ncbi:hypothetical protein W03_15260 [Nitrosomonas sp. PY1]|uniref:hypothetical protein n=1 Tax=Nitrosomonas sp. PY1 TaxID=1803906 RepID=UPI001FC849BA|nr:hypothetical protein [Nitrosomonas sp. PY1]GKS69522.1 hypothetical protein W03_15260 [Nitrosomonas sp. PY1]
MRIIILTLISLLGGSQAYAFDINPFKKYDGSHELVLNDENTQKAAGVVASIIIHPVHEELTVRSFNLVKERRMPGFERINDELIETVIRGVRWNDDPLNLLPDHPIAWFDNFKNASENSDRITSHYDLFYRSHHHDLQFLHAMASSDQEKAGDTLKAVMMWSEFSYKVASGFIPIHTHLDKMHQFLSPEAARSFKKHFTHDGLRKKWTPAYLFSLKCIREKVGSNLFTPLDCSETDWRPMKKNVQNIALGSLLHVIQDSFSDSHVSRNPEYEGEYSLIHGRSKINNFNAYTKQSFNLHRGADGYPRDFEAAMSEQDLNLEEACAQVISNVLLDRNKSKKGTHWRKTANYLENGVFRIINPNALAGAGKYE